MAELFLMPRLGQSMEEGTVLQWYKKEGDAIKRGEPLLEVMSDKANFDVEATEDGIVRKLLVPENEIVSVNAPLAILGTADEPIDHLLGTSASDAAAPPVANTPSASAIPAGLAPSSVSQSEAVAVGSAESLPATFSPRARHLADEHRIPVAALSGTGTGPEGRIIERDVKAYLEKQKSLASSMGGPASGGSLIAGTKTGSDSPLAPPESRQRVTPLAARMADDLGINLKDLSQGLPGSRIMADDVRKRLETSVTTPAAGTTFLAPPPVGSGTPIVPTALSTQLPITTSPANSEGPTVSQVIPLRGLRKMVADNVTRSRQTAPHVTLTLEVDMTETAVLFDRMRAEILKAYETKLTYTDLLIKAVARALADHPLCNAALIGDEIRCYTDKNIGVAVATDAALIVPVIKGADKKPMGEVSKEFKTLVERCRAGKPTQDDLSGGTFTITNLGAFGIDVFDPIIVPPQSCILGVGRIADKPIVHNKQVVVRAMMNLCLSFDHRVLDGVPAARFLQRLKELLESPLLIFV